MSRHTAYIFITGPTKQELIAAVQMMAEAYSDTPFANGINIYKSSQSDFIVRFSNTPDFERFKYFVNYLSYPEIEHYKAEVRGYWTVQEGDNLDVHLNHQVQLFVPDFETGGDNVFGIFQGSNIVVKMGFDIGNEYLVIGDQPEFQFTEPTIDETDLVLVESVRSTRNSGKKKSRGCMIVAGTLFGGVILLSLIKV